MENFNRCWLWAYSNGTILSRRETEVLIHVAEGEKTELVAHNLGIAPQTVKNHIGRIMAKLHARNRTHAAILAMSQHWIPEV